MEQKIQRCAIGVHVGILISCMLMVKKRVPQTELNIEMVAIMRRRDQAPSVLKRLCGFEEVPRYVAGAGIPLLCVFFFEILRTRNQST